MQTIEIKGAFKNSRVVVGEKLENLPCYLPPERQTVCISDAAVWPLYGQSLNLPYILIGRGEKHKTLDTLAFIYDRLLELGCDRGVFILALGGGIVCDVAGFAAATYMRGVDCGFIPTTLLAQTDASVGGKNGIDVLGYKNIAGTFNQPNFVLCSPQVLKTLPANEIANGMAEIVKHALIADLKMFEYIENHTAQIMALEPDCINYLVSRSVEIKAAVVNADERERGERRKLNFGHTLGHAIEKSTGCSHGQAVAKGMLYATAVSIARGHMAPQFYGRLQRLLKNLGLPWQTPSLTKELLDAMAADKKREGQSLHFVLLEEVGRASVCKIEFSELENMDLSGVFNHEHVG